MWSVRMMPLALLICVAKGPDPNTAQRAADRAARSIRNSLRKVTGPGRRELDHDGRMLRKIPAYARQIDVRSDGVPLQLGGGTDTRKQQQLRRVVGSAAQNDFPVGPHDPDLSALGHTRRRPRAPAL